MTRFTTGTNMWDVRVEVFKEAWRQADELGMEGRRTKAGLIAVDAFDRAFTGSPVFDPELPKTGMALSEARAKLSGLHLSKEALSEGEREILYLAEGLLRLYDEQTGPQA